MVNDDYQKFLTSIGELQKQVLPLTTMAQQISASISEPMTELYKSVSITSEIIAKAIKSTEFSSTLTAISNMAENINSLQIPHISLYRDILEVIDKDSFEQFRMDDILIDAEEDNTEEIKITRPYFYDAAVKINMYVTVTNDHIQHSENISEDDKTLWEKYIRPALNVIMTLFITWAMGDTPFSEMQIVEQFEKVIEIVDEYQYPIETTDPEIKEIDNE